MTSHETYYGICDDFVIIMEPTYSTPKHVDNINDETRMYKGNHFFVKAIVKKNDLYKNKMNYQNCENLFDEIIDNTTIMANNKIHYAVNKITKITDYKLIDEFIKINNNNVKIQSSILSRGIPYFKNINQAFHFNGNIPDTYTGRVTNYDANGFLKACGFIENGKSVGQWNFYNSTKKLIMTGKFINDEEHGPWFGFENGIISWFRFFVNGNVIYEYNYHEDVCCICHEPHTITDIMTRLSCGHMFHYSCYTKWNNKKRTCPLCRTSINNFCPECY